MLKDKTSSAIVAVRDIAQARVFYGDVLGLELEDDSMEGVLAFRTGETRLIVYRSDEAGTNRANAVVWGVGEELDTIVAELEAKGVTFEQYPGLGGARLEGNVHVVEGPASATTGTAELRLAWLKDPDGNILHLNTM